LLTTVSRVSPLTASSAHLVVLERPGHAAAEAERDVVLCGVFAAPGAVLSCDEKKKVPVIGANVSKVSLSTSCAR
jgi:hypothetical protein